MQESDEANSPNDSVSLGNLRALLEGVQHRIFCKLDEGEGFLKTGGGGTWKVTNLLVELFNIRISSILHLNVSGVLLQFLGGGHLSGR